MQSHNTRWKRNWETGKQELATNGVQFILEKRCSTCSTRLRAIFYVILCYLLFVMRSLVFRVFFEYI